jgi:hypothetical protein
MTAINVSVSVGITVLAFGENWYLQISNFELWPTCAATGNFYN